MTWFFIFSTYFLLKNGLTLKKIKYFRRKSADFSELFAKKHNDLTQNDTVWGSFMVLLALLDLKIEVQWVILDPIDPQKLVFLS